MTLITISKDQNGSYKKLICKGHSGFAKAGKDIVCASVSVLVINTINALEDLGNESFETISNEEDGFIRCDFPYPLHENSIFLLDAMVYGLLNIQIEYGNKYLQVKFEEV